MTEPELEREYRRGYDDGVRHTLLGGIVFFLVFLGGVAAGVAIEALLL